MRKFLFALPLCLTALSAAAEPVPEEHVVVTASRKPQPAAQVGASVTVIDADAARAKGQVFVADALRGVPGVTVTQNGGPGGLAVVRLRGEEAYRTLVLIDGIRVSDPAGPQDSTDFTHIPLAGISRIEIVRGPQSLIYGADAIGGVVNIVTRRAAEEGVRAALFAELGGFGTASGALTMLLGRDAFDAALTLSRFHSDGFSAREGAGFTEDDPFDNATVHAVFGYAPDDETRLEGVFRATASQAAFDRFADTDDTLYTEQVMGRLSARFALGALENVLAADYTTLDRADYEGNMPFVFGARFDGERTRLDYLGHLALSERYEASFGVDFLDESVVTDFVAQGRDGYGAYAEIRAEPLDGLFLTAGLRYDALDGSPGHESVRLTAAYLAGETKFRAAFGTGFRVPSLFELYDAFSGNPDLREETGIGFDAGIDQTLPGGWGRLSLTWFDQRIEDEIRFDPNVFVYIQNEGVSASRGIEAELVLDLADGVTLDAGYTYDDTEIASNDLEDGLPRLRRPLHSGFVNLAVEALAGRLRLDAGVRGAARSFDGFYVFRTKLADYVVVDVSGSYELVPGLRAFVRGANVLDEDYQEVQGFAAPDAAFYAGLKGEF